MQNREIKPKLKPVISDRNTMVQFDPQHSLLREQQLELEKISETKGTRGKQHKVKVKSF